MKTKISKYYSIREATLEDAEVIWQAIDSHRDYLKTWLPFVPKLQKVEDEAAFLSATLSVPYDERNIVFVIEKNDEFCGLIGFVNTDNNNHRTEIGYWLLPEHQGQGLMTQCVKYLCQWAVRERSMHRIQICCAVGNHPSNAIPKRLGFKLEGTIRHGELLASGEYVDINVYGILKEEI
ncbi:GNAT family N-acetyltransferase [Parabacteroides bouchesdurhonensis]|uniref:GNAT family N-acetyltransferase n=1 Tax=Parabacteroides bouchesdurhonensis TaxID=1936995 RepID=UPI000C857C65|nr:GNAT family N-acetyltransferase [Parabacteroides bouchesdurhonensis]